MRILIITTYYPPDTAIAAVRPYMFAKYLKQFGHDVTVLRSGLLSLPPDRFFAGHEGIRVVSYLGENSPSVRFEQDPNNYIQNILPAKKLRLAFLPDMLRKVIAKIYHTLMSPYLFYRQYQKTHRQGRFKPMKAAIDRMADEKFDVVFSTYGPLENIWGGEYAAKLFGAKWVQDFRDPVDTSLASKFSLPFLRRTQKKAVRSCDLCTAVSEDLAKHLSVQAGGKTIHTLHNGYSPFPEIAPLESTSKENALSICYTGLLYVGKQDFTPVLHALQHLKTQNKIDLSHVRLHYAGNDFAYLEAVAKKTGTEEILVNHGYVSRAEAALIQQSSDLYTVLSWNTKQERGVLTGKFYEGIRAGKPILSIINGNAPHSELFVINEKYHYGFCYEKCREKEQFQQLCDYLEVLYKEKMSTGKISYNPNPALITDFRYDTLAKQLEKLCCQLLPQPAGDTL